MKRILLTLILLILSVTLFGCSSHEAVLSIDCNKRHLKIQSSNFKKMTYSRYKTAFIEKKDYTSRFKIRKELANNLANSLINACSLLEFQYTPTKEEIQAELELAYKRYSSKENFYKVMEKIGRTEEDHQAQYSLNAQKRKLIEKMGTGKISDKEIQDYYQKNKYKYTTPKKTYINDILIKTNFATIKREIIEDDKQNKMIAAQVDDLARKKQAENEQLITELREKLKQNPKNFPNLAKIYSQDKERAESGGEFILEEVNSKYPREFIETIEKLEVGQVSEPTRSQYGTHFLYKREIAPEKTQPLSEVKEDVKERIYNSKEHIFFKEVLKKQESEFKITYHDKTLHPDYEKNTNFFQKIIDTIFE